MLIETANGSSAVMFLQSSALNDIPLWSSVARFVAQWRISAPVTSRRSAEAS